MQYIINFRDKLNSYTQELLRERKSANPSIDPLYSIFNDSGRGGKCIRGSLVKLGYEIAVGKDADERIMPIAAAFEILQTALLCHDDIIDRSPTRRGKPSVWRHIANESGSEHYGISQGICLGDFGLVVANDLVAASDFEPELKIKALQLFARVQINTLNGEMLDVQMTEAKDYSDEARTIEISYLKTAFYTVIGPMQLGAVLGGANQTLLDNMEKFGENLGIAFQLRDDLLGARADESETGKSGMSDIAEGKVTLLIHYARQNASEEQRAALARYYGKIDLTNDERAAVNHIFDSTGAFKKVESKVSEYAARAESFIDIIANGTAHKDILRELVLFLSF